MKYKKYYSQFKDLLPKLIMLEERNTREKNLIETFAKDNCDLDYARRWKAPLLKKKLKTKTMIIVNSILVCVIIYLIIK